MSTVAQPKESSESKLAGRLDDHVGNAAIGTSVRFGQQRTAKRQRRGSGVRVLRLPYTPQRLASLQDLVGAELIGFRFDRNMTTAIVLEWNLVDG